MSFASKKKSLSPQEQIKRAREFTSFLFHNISILPIEPLNEEQIEFNEKNQDRINNWKLQLVLHRHNLRMLKKIVDQAISNGQTISLPGVPGQYFPKEIFEYIKQKTAAAWR
ncbi:MAG: hypothetical protein Q6363_007980 [Candidatus Njordarchaeota archaeon]